MVESKQYMKESNEGLNAWYQKLKQLAESKELGWLLGDAECYLDYYNEGAEPQEALEDEIEAARSSC